MLAEFALDPALMGNWRDFRFFVAQFGVAQGRLISRFPKAWKDMVRTAAASAGEVEFLRIVEALNRIDECMLVREYDYQKQHTWIRNAIDENTRRPFHAIVAGGAYPSVLNLLEASDIDPTNPPTLWKVPKSVNIERTPVQMASCVACLLSQCSEIIFIDPYFGPGKKKHTEPLKHFLQAIAARGTRKMPIRIEYHTGNQDLGTAKFQSDLDTWVQPHLPSKVALSVVRWDKDQMHNRYIVTERGGVMFGHGLDQDDAIPVGHDTVTLLEVATCSELMHDYSPQSKKLKWLNEIFTVAGL